MLAPTLLKMLVDNGQPIESRLSDHFGNEWPRYGVRLLLLAQYYYRELNEQEIEGLKKLQDWAEETIEAGVAFKQSRDNEH